MRVIASLASGDEPPASSARRGIAPLRAEAREPATAQHRRVAAAMPQPYGASGRRRLELRRPSAAARARLVEAVAAHPGAARQRPRAAPRTAASSVGDVAPTRRSRAAPGAPPSPPDADAGRSGRGAASRRRQSMTAAPAQPREHGRARRPRRDATALDRHRRQRTGTARVERHERARSRGSSDRARQSDDGSGFASFSFISWSQQTSVPLPGLLQSASVPQASQR